MASESIWPDGRLSRPTRMSPGGGDGGKRRDIAHRHLRRERFADDSPQSRDADDRFAHDYVITPVSVLEGLFPRLTCLFLRLFLSSATVLWCFSRGLRCLWAGIVSERLGRVEG